MSPAALRTRAMEIASGDPERALELARTIPDPWYRAQALAASARWIDDARVDGIAEESLAAAAACHDDYKRAAVASWPIRALLERGRNALAAAALDEARARALAASPAASRAEALFGLLQGGWSLGAETRRRLVEDLTATHAIDPSWRVSRCLIDALVLLHAPDPDAAAELCGRIGDQRLRAKALAAMQKGWPRAPRDYFET